MIRTFQPIGQGTFVTERFEKGQNVVFDCGSLTSLDLVKKQIHEIYKENEQIDAVFISSLDNEHAGGLEVLMQWCRVTKVFVPFYSEDERAYTLLKHFCEGGEPDDFLSRLIMDPKNALSAYQFLDPRLPVLTQVAPEAGWDRNVFDVNMAIALMPWKSIEGFRVYVDPDLDWVCQPHVFRQRQALDELVRELAMAGVDPGWVADAATVRRAWRQNPTRQSLMQVFGQCRHRNCVVSMATYSGPMIRVYAMYERYQSIGRGYLPLRMRPGGIYTGDLCLKDEETRTRFLKQFGNYRLRVGCFQLPAHGAEEWFHENILPLGNAVVVGTAGTENVLRLPHGQVVRTLMERRLPFYLVTEMPDSSAQFLVKERIG